MKNILIYFIKMYQKHISPRKGYGCAYRLQGYSKVGCSGNALKVLARYPIIMALMLIRRRLDRCSYHARLLRNSYKEKASKQPTYRALAHSQAGFVDCDPGGCDVPSCDAPDCSMDLPSCEMPDCTPDVTIPNCNLPYNPSTCMPSFTDAACDCGYLDCGSNAGADREENRRQVKEEKKTKRNKKDKKQETVEPEQPVDNNDFTI